MSDWKGLRKLLEGVEDTVTLTWAELDQLVGGLPPSANDHRPFWAGDRSMWRGFRTRDVVMGSRVTFVRVDLGPSAVDAAQRIGNASEVHVRTSDEHDLLRRVAELETRLSTINIVVNALEARVRGLEA